MEENELEYDIDPELRDDDTCDGDEDAYDGEAVDFIQFDPTLFELDVDVEVVQNGD